MNKTPTKGQTEGKETFWTRLVSAAEAAGQKTTQEALGDLVGVKQSSSRKWKTGEALPTMANSVRLAERLGVCVEWLLTGRGSRKPLKPLSDEVLEIADLWGLMDEERRKDLVGYAKYCRTISSAPPRPISAVLPRH